MSGPTPPHAPAEHSTEAARLASLRAVEDVASARGPVFDSLVLAASTLCGAPVPLLTLLGHDPRWAEAHPGKAAPGDRVPPTLSASQRGVLTHLARAAGDALLQQQAAQAFQETELRYRILIDDQSELVSLAHPDGTLTFVNKAYAAMFGRDAAEMIGRSLYDYVAPEEQENVRAHFRSVCAEAHSASGENRMIDAQGQLRWIQWTNRAIRALDGSILSVHSVGRDITARRLAEAALEQERQRIQNILDGTHAGTWEWNVATGAVRLDARWAEILGYALEDLQPISIATWAQLTHPEDLERARPQLQSHFAEQSAVYDCDLRMLHRDGRWIWVNARGRVLTRLPDGSPEWMFGTHLDISERQRLSTELAEQLELLKVTLQSIGDAVITTDAHGVVNWLNPVAERMTGWLSEDAAGRPLSEVFHIVNEETRAITENPVATCLAQGKIVGLANHTLLISRDGSEFGIEDSAAPIRTASGEVLGVVLVFHDVSEQRRLSGEMTFRASHDQLTGLLNRSEFETRLLRVLRQAHEDHSEHAMLYLDLDQFKLVNDACGHAVGDQLLQQVAKLLRESVRGRDTLARLGGDEFAVILEHCTPHQAALVGQKICDRMDDFRFLHEERRFRIGASIGLVPVDRRWANAAAIQQAADTACYAAKEAGRNRVHAWFDTDQAMRARQFEMQWTSRIERALDEDRFALFFQRVQPLRKVQQPVHAEVLLRLPNEDGTLSLPGAFLPAAERFHLASRVDRWVLRQVIEHMRAAPRLECIGMLSVNLSGQSVGDRAFHSWAHDMLERAGQAIRSRLCLEITETAAVTNLADAAAFIKHVRSAGVRVALDDFGAGASSFGYLKTLPVDFLKIDGQFIRDLTSDPLDEAAVRCFADVARLVGVQTVAEFVDNEDTLARLKELDVDYAQGYLIHQPEPLEYLTSQTAHASAQPSQA